jgi:DNA-binding SARP family transcriptional activator/TolB-like protein
MSLALQPPAPLPIADIAQAIDGGRDARLRLRLFGTMEATDASGASVLPRSRKARALLAVLALAAPRAVLRVRMTGLLWSSRENEQARASLRQVLHELQEALGQGAGALLSADRNQLALRDDQLWVDATELAHAAAATPDVLDLVRGEFLDELDGLDPGFDRWLSTERARLRAIGRALGESILAVQQGHTRIVAAAERLLAIDPSHEGAWRGIIGAALDRGDRGAAIAALERCQTALAKRGGFPPPADLVSRIAELRWPEGRPAGPQAGAAPLGVTAPGVGTPARREGGIRLGVMPMRSLDGKGDDPLSLGLAEEITTALSRFRWISCLASTSLGALAGEPHDGKLWERLDLDFMLDGTVQRSGDRVRITSRLLDMRDNAAVIWARRFDRETTDILTLQDEIAAETVAQVDPELLLREGERASNRPPPPHPTAYELMLRAIPSVYRLEQTGFLAAGDMLRAAIGIDPGHAASHAWLAYWHLFHVGQGWAQDPHAATVQGGLLADRAVTLDPNDARGLTLSGHVRAFLGRRSEEGIALHQRALSLNPNMPMAWAFYGLAQSYLGAHDEAIRCIEHAHRLSPFDPHGFFFDMALMVPYMLKRDHEAALRIGRRAVELNPGFSSSHKGVLAVLGHLGRSAEAAELLARLLVLEPRLTLEDAVSRSPILVPGDLAHYAEGLRLAGLR